MLKNAKERAYLPPSKPRRKDKIFTGAKKPGYANAYPG